jgi:hypothetical protein
MRCPKCGYNSFDHLDKCKKCGKDLSEHKVRFSIKSVLLSELPTELTSKAAEEVLEAAVNAVGDISIEDFSPGNDPEDVDDFGFDFMGDSEDEENLAFDELFEEVSAEDDVEETLPGPKSAKQTEPSPQAPGKNKPVKSAEFGFDFMGDSDDDEDLAFDELFEEVSSEDDVEEALPEPKASEPIRPRQAESVQSKTDPELEALSTDEFGFDADEDPAADIFAETEEDFSLDSFDFEESEKK